MKLVDTLTQEWRIGPCRCANNLTRWSVFEGGWSNRLTTGWCLSKSGLYFKKGAARYGARRPRKFKVSRKATPLPL